MISVEYSLTNSILNNIVALEQSRWQMTQQEILPSDLEKLQREALEKDLRLIANLLKLDATHEKIMAIYEGRELILSLGQLRLVANYKNVRDYIDNLRFNKTTVVSFEMVKHVNKLLTQGLVEMWDCGKIRTASDRLIDTNDTWALLYGKETKDTYSFKQQIGNHHHELLSANPKMHPIVHAALASALLFISYPFVAMNQLTLLATLQMILEVSKYNPRSMCSFLNCVQEVDQDLFPLVKKNIEQISNNHIVELTELVELLVYGLSKTYRNDAQDLNQEMRLQATYKKKMTKKLNQRQRFVLRYIERFGKITTAIFRKNTKTTAMTASRDFRQLIELKLIQRLGDGRGVYYISFQEIPESPPEELPKTAADDTLPLDNTTYFEEVRSLRELE